MRLKTAHVRNYRSVRDTGVFDVEMAKTILVGPNEAGKTAILQAIQQLNPPEGVKKFDALRDYPRALYNDITRGAVNPAQVPVVTGVFELEDADRALLPDGYESVRYSFTRYLDNHAAHDLVGGPEVSTYGELKKDLLRLGAHMDARSPVPGEGQAVEELPSVRLAALISGWGDQTRLTKEITRPVCTFLQQKIALVDETNSTEEQRYDRIVAALSTDGNRDASLKALFPRLPKFVLFSNYFRVRPIIHLAHLAQRLSTKVLDDAQYDYGNSCLLKLLGFTAQELSDLGRAGDPQLNQSAQLEAYRAQLDKRSYQLNAASVQLTNEIKRVWNPSSSRPEASRLRVVADGQYLKVVVEDELGVEVELDQRSEGFQWLVSFFVVFFAEAMGQHENAILLLDEPGMSLHALKQREFRDTISRLAEKNQTIYSTHSPFLVGPGELDLVRVVELNDRNIGTKVHTSVTSSDPAALLPLQEALGYDLAQSLFAQHRNLILEGLTDYWYLEAVASLLSESGAVKLNEKIALVPSNTAGKVVYFATILHAQNLKVAALLDSDGAGDQAAQQDTLVHTLGQKRILRTKDFIPSVAKAEIEDLLRDTLPIIARDMLSLDVMGQVSAQPGRPIIDIFSGEPGFSKYKLAKSFLRWTRDHVASDLSEAERGGWIALISAINAALR